jgi:hypothetical protein
MNNRADPLTSTVPYRQFINCLDHPQSIQLATSFCMQGSALALSIVAHLASPLHAIIIPECSIMRETHVNAEMTILSKVKPHLVLASSCQLPHSRSPPHCQSQSLSSTPYLADWW